MRAARGVTALNCAAFASFHGVSVHGQDQGTDTLSRCIAGKRGGACVSLLLDSAGPTFTHQMHPLRLYLEADRAPQGQHVQNCISGCLSHTSRPLPGPPSACAAPSTSQPPDPRSPFTSTSSSPPHQPSPRPAHFTS